jgi:hypothetical protein
VAWTIVSIRSGRDVGDQDREFAVVVVKMRRLIEVVSLIKGTDE